MLLVLGGCRLHHQEMMKKEDRSSYQSVIGILCFFKVVRRGSPKSESADRAYLKIIRAGGVSTAFLVAQHDIIITGNWVVVG